MHEPLALEDFVPPAALEPASVYGIAPIRFKNVTAYFDNMTGGGTSRRALCACKLDKHKAVIGWCEKEFSFVQLF